MMTDNKHNHEIVLEAKGITKQFPGVLANDHVDLTLHRGEIIALLGENGAGKSTLMNIIFGLYHADSGTVKLKGKEVSFVSPREAIHSGIGMVHQHFQLVPVMSVAENVILGEEVTDGLFLNRAEAARRVRDLSGKYNLAVDPDAIIEELPVGTQQRVEIIKALYRDAEILILDEPTAVLTPQEVQELFKVMRELATQGVSIIFITHKLKEVLAVSDRIVVMRGGAVVGDAEPQHSTPESLAALMVGREVLLRVEKDEAKPEGSVLVVDKLSAIDDREHQALTDVSFEVRAGEVLGVAGVQGNGQTELVEVITGLRKLESGQVTINGKDLTNARPREVTQSSVGHVPEDRHRYGMVSPFTVAENLVLNVYNKLPYSSAPSPRSMPTIGLLYMLVAVPIVTVLYILWQSLWENALWSVVLDIFGIENVEEASRQMMDAPEYTKLFAALIVGGGILSVAHLAASFVIQRTNAVSRFEALVKERRGRIANGVIWLVVFTVGLSLFVGDLYVMLLLPLSGLIESLIHTTFAIAPAVHNLLLLVVFAGILLFAYRLVLTALKSEDGLSFDAQAIDDHAGGLVKEYDIRTPSILTSGGSLSGGNQQKMVVAREFGRKPALLIAAQPTRGIDVGSIEFIHQQIVAQRDEGAAVLLVSAELDEITALSDRIAVMYKGHVVATVDAASVTREQLGLLMAGASADEVLTAA